MYTVDGTLPTLTNGTVYAAPFTVVSTTTVTAVTTTVGKLNSSPAVASFSVSIFCDFYVVPVTITPGSGSSANDVDVTMDTSTVGATICYTTDGSTPLCNADGSCQAGETYAGTAVAVTKTATKLTAVGCREGMNPSSTLSAIYTLATAPVAFDPPAGALPANTAISLSSATLGAEIRLRTDGVDPTCTTGTVYTAPIPLAQNVSYRAIACRNDYEPSAPAVATYVVQ